MKKAGLAGITIVVILLSSCASGIPPHIAAKFSSAPSTPEAIQAEALRESNVDQAAHPPSAQVSFSESDQRAGSGAGNPGPDQSSDVNIPPPAEAIELAEGQINILMLGSDQRPNDAGFRTDVILLLSINPSDGKVALISFPRDLYIYQPGWHMDRLNTAYARGEFELVAQSFEYNFGIRPDHWVLVNFDGFREIIDALGGISVDVGQGLVDQRDGYGQYSVSQGNVLMDAETALWYVRSRGSSDDFDRTRRQQEVLKAIFFRSISLEMLSNAVNVYDAYKEMVQTDLAFSDLLPLLSLTAQLDNGGIEGSRIGPNQVSAYTTSSGASVLLPDRQGIRQLLLESLGGPES